jgi:hypothetical protein
MVSDEDQDVMNLDKYEMTPEEAVLFEKMNSNIAQLKKFGIRELRVIEKI